MGDIVEDDESEKVEIVLKTIGPAPPSRLLVPSSIKVSRYAAIISSLHIPISIFRVFFFWGIGKEDKIHITSRPIEHPFIFDPKFH